MNAFKRIGAIIAITLVLSVFVALISYQWPRTATFRIVDTEVKRIEGGDQYRITAIRQEDDKRMVLRNEDAWYRFKFDSADIQGDAAIAEKNDFMVEMTYYGWRSNLMSWFWNVSDLDILREKAPAPTPQE
ncbi:DUF1523 family protein [Nitrosococcus oceani]|uniref:DUF1523 domain-containing protein n=2 Tax=Nitrosococcus oceani TaxID=1229 RepID=Q3J726_NITOC|nr:DUF1523 family protein [Nitrosococcus oceani]KFI18106.1 hypothetical protein IB75_15530 [Nitrosococcus oceani C-27]ABA59370.1 conserved hypothetical protein [Nitrosococcus oceani ATCC 19707]EDZ65953.1 hypothetical protein NOC27_2633 [Nitrosococcus oceani AFC27]KFI21387.1 hypothetical protein HW44_15160 [Nitrosococcus oceani]GEM20059.1 hypothetical protein NONS58_14640 [Nitrosococcus oceani]